MKLPRALVIVALLLPVTAHHAVGQAAIPAEGRITGTVIDEETGQPVMTATVGVWRTADSTLVTGAVTEPDGRFAVEGLRDGHYYARISFVGFHTHDVPDVAIGDGSRSVDLGTIRLSPDTQMLEEVEVQAERTSVQFGIDRTTYSTANSPVAAGGTATNVLETIPSIDVDVDGNISLRGTGNVAVLINGRPAPVSAEYIATYLRQLPASSIDRIEVIPNPSARYEPDGMGGIINIILKQDAELGFGGTVMGGGDSQGGYNASGTFTYGRGPVNLAMTYGFRQEEGLGGGDSFRINRYAEPLTYFDQVEDQDESETSHFLSLSGDLHLSPKTALNASAQAGLEREVEKEIGSFLELDALRAPINDYERLVTERGDGWNADVRIGLTHMFSGMATGRAGGPAGGGFGGRGGPGGRFGGPGGPGGGPALGNAGGGGHSLTVEARFDASADDGEELFTERFSADDALRERQNAYTDRNHQEASLQIDYVRPLAGLKLEAGYKGDLEAMYSDLFSESAEGSDPLVPDVGLINTFDFDQQIHAAYLQVGRQFGPVGVQLGMRGEIATTTFTLKNTDEAFDNDYNSLFPSAFLTYRFSEATMLRGGYSRRIQRPRTWFLNPFPSYDDPLNIRMGNPSLRPEYIDALELGYVQLTPWGSVTLTPFYRRTTDVIRFYQQLRDDGVTIRTSGNFDSASSSGIELITSIDADALLPGLGGYISFEGFRLVTDGSNVDASFQNNAFAWGGRLNASYSLGNVGGLGELVVQATVRYRAPMDTEQGRMGSFSWTDLAVRQSLFGDHASLTVRARDLLGTAGFSSIIDQPDLYNEFSREFGAQAVGVTFSYSFGRQQERRENEEQGPENGFEQQGQME